MFVRKSTKDSTPILHRLVVEKHGSHNQSSHGRKGGGGGGGGGSASPEASSEASDKARTTTAKVLVDDMTEAENQLDNMRGDRLSNAETALVDRAITRIGSAKEKFQEAQSLKGKEQTDKMQTGVGNVFSAANQLLMVDDDEVEDIVNNILDDVRATFGDSDSTFTELGLDVDDLFGP
jgi:hypothetical protein